MPVVTQEMIVRGNELLCLAGQLSQRSTHELQGFRRSYPVIPSEGGHWPSARSGRMRRAECCCYNCSNRRWGSLRRPSFARTTHAHLARKQQSCNARDKSSAVRTEEAQISPLRSDWPLSKAKKAHIRLTSYASGHRPVS